MKYYLGVDIGTFESKAALVDGEGNIVASAAQPHQMLVPQSGWAEHEPEENWWGEFAKLSKKVIAESGVNPKQIRAVGASAIGPCMLPVGIDGNPLMNGVLYGVDTRASDEIAFLNNEYGAEAILRDTGNALTSQSVGPKILWLKNNRPDLYSKTHKFITSTTFIVHRLTGQYVIDHYSAGSFGPLYLPEHGGWHTRYCEHIAPLEKLADVKWTTEIAGNVTQRAADATGLAVGTPVITGTIDAASEAASVGVLDPGQMMIMYGSTIFIILVAKARVNDPCLWYSPWLFPNQHATMAGQSTSGTLTHWFRETFAREFVDSKTAAIALAKEAASSPPGAKGLIVLPYFSGERTPIHDTSAKGMIFGLDLTHNRADIYRAIIEGIAHGTAHVVQTFVQTGIAPLQVEAVGGGTNNALWLQASSDTTGLQQNLRTKTIGASYGDAFLAALGLGDVAKGDIMKWNPAARTVSPHPENSALYAKRFTSFRALYERNKDLMREV